MRMRRNLESLSLRLRSRCFRTATAWKLQSAPYIYISIHIPGEENGGGGGTGETNLLDQHVQVLGNLRSEAWWRAKKGHSVSQRPSRGKTEARGSRRGKAVPSRLRMRRILFPNSSVSTTTKWRERRRWGGGCTSDNLDLCDSVGVTEDYTDL